jgi:hypothetical protein
MFRRLQYLTPWSPSLQHIRDSAAPRLDFVDFIASETVVSLDFVAELAKIPEFSAAVAAYRSLLPLGYCGFFCWPAVHHVFRQIAEEPLLDYLRVAAYCNDVPAADRRHIDLDTASAKQRFLLFSILTISRWGRCGPAMFLRCWPKWDRSRPAMNFARLDLPL